MSSRIEALPEAGPVLVLGDGPNQNEVEKVLQGSRLRYVISAVKVGVVADQRIRELEEYPYEIIETDGSGVQEERLLRLGYPTIDLRKNNREKR